MISTNRPLENIAALRALGINGFPASRTFSRLASGELPARIAMVVCPNMRRTVRRID
jgi:hypothetical protein